MENKVTDIQGKDTFEKRRKRLGGFSFIEVMVVIIILGLLSSIVGVYLFDSAEQAKADATKSQIKGLEAFSRVVVIASTVTRGCF